RKIQDPPDNAFVAEPDLALAVRLRNERLQLFAGPLATAQGIGFAEAHEPGEPVGVEGNQEQNGAGYTGEREEREGGKKAESLRERAAHHFGEAVGKNEGKG